MKPLKPEELKVGMKVIVLTENLFYLRDKIKEINRSTLIFPFIGKMRSYENKIFADDKITKTKLLLSDIELYKRIYR